MRCRRWGRRRRGYATLEATLLSPNNPLRKGSFREVHCFHAQQAAEKALKAALVAKGVPFPHTHDLARLIGLLDSCGSSVPYELREAAGLTVYAVATRYPGPEDDLETEELREAVEIAGRVVAWVESFIEDA